MVCFAQAKLDKDSRYVGSRVFLADNGHMFKKLKHIILQGKATSPNCNYLGVVIGDSSHIEFSKC